MLSRMAFPLQVYFLFHTRKIIQQYINARNYLQTDNYVLILKWFIYPVKSDGFKREFFLFTVTCCPVHSGWEIDLKRSLNAM